ncbi:MAG: GTPase RsgA, partial [Clostridia bacterium]
MIKGVVVKNISGQVEVNSFDKNYTCSIRKTVKMKDPRSEQINERVMIGDNVIIDEKTMAIEQILPRRNELKRPHVSNIDCLLIFLSPLPEPDFYLVDKIIMQADALALENYIIINKSDEASNEFICNVKDQYNGVVNGIYVISSKENKIDAGLIKLLKGKLTALAGQSGVGKSTFINAMMG